MRGRGSPAKSHEVEPEGDKLTGQLDPYGVRKLLINHRIWPGTVYRNEPGECRWCGRTIYKPSGEVNRRKPFCDKACAREYNLRADPRLMRKYVYDRDLGICQGCREVFDFYEDDGWQCDHIRPLFMARGDWSFWDPTNVQLLCIPCHEQKTAEDSRKYRTSLRRRREQKARRKRR